MSIATALLDDLEHYYDEVPRVTAVVEEIGPFTLFLRDGAEGWQFYARPHLGYAGSFSVEQIDEVRQRQREAGAPEAFEWVADATPALESVARDAGLEVERYPLMVLRGAAAKPSSQAEVVMLDADDDRIGRVQAVVNASFGETDAVGEPAHVDAVRLGITRGTLRVSGAFHAGEAVGGGSHSPRSGVTELMGIGVLPRARRAGIGAAITAELVEDARRLGVTTVFLSAGSQRIADIYARVGFETVATACIAEPAE